MDECSSTPAETEYTPAPLSVAVHISKVVLLNVTFVVLPAIDTAPPFPLADPLRIVMPLNLIWEPLLMTKGRKEPPASSTGDLPLLMVVRRPLMVRADSRPMSFSTTTVNASQLYPPDKTAAEKSLKFATGTVMLGLQLGWQLPMHFNARRGEYGEHLTSELTAKIS